MLQETNLILFLTASLALIVAPGPDNILVLTQGIAQGRGAALVSAAGARVGVVIHSGFAAVGLSPTCLDGDLKTHTKRLTLARDRGALIPRI